MSEEKRLEIEIGWYKVVFAILVATDISLLAWLAQMYHNLEPVLVIVSVFAVFAITIGIYFLNKRVFKCLDRIEEL